MNQPIELSDGRERELLQSMEQSTPPEHALSQEVARGNDPSNRPPTVRGQTGVWGGGTKGSTHPAALKALATATAFAFAIVWVSPNPVCAAPSVGLIDFNAGPADFTVVSTADAPGGPWTWDSLGGTWSAFDPIMACFSPGFRSTRLMSPILTVTTAGPVTLTFNHRFSFEADPERWDGGQLRVSVNRGPYVTVPVANFVSGGYNSTVYGFSRCELVGQEAFTGQSADYDISAYITSIARLGSFNRNDTISIQFLGAWDDCEQGSVPNWEIDSVQFDPPLEDRRSVPLFTTPALPADAVVWQERAHTLRVEVTGHVSLQWFKDRVPIPGANASTYTITNMTPDDAGLYSVQAINSTGNSVSRTASVAFRLDNSAPVLLHAFNDPVDLTAFTLNFDERLCDTLTCGNDAQDAFSYSVESFDPVERLGVFSATLVNGTDVILRTSARTPGRAYHIRVEPIGDIFGNATNAEVEVNDSLLFQQDVNGYSGTADTELRGAAPGIAQGGNTFVTVDLDDAGGVSQGLLRFDNIFGSNADQVPPGAVIVSAELTLRHNMEAARGTPVNLHRMLVPWSEDTATYDSFVNGIQVDGVEAGTATEAIIVSMGLATPFTLTVNVASTMQAWADGAANFGWAFSAIGTDGYRWDTSETTTPPSLTIRAVRKPSLTLARNADGSRTVSWPASRSWQLMSSTNVAGPYAPVAGDPSGPVTIAAGALAPTTFYVLRYRGR